MSLANRRFHLVSPGNLTDAPILPNDAVNDTSHDTSSNAPQSISDTMEEPSGVGRVEDPNTGTGESGYLPYQFRRGSRFLSATGHAQDHATSINLPQESAAVAPNMHSPAQHAAWVGAWGGSEPARGENLTSNQVSASVSQPPPAVNGRAHVHRHHPSNSGVHFGTFDDSSNSSPAPPLSGGIAPPPGMHAANGRHPYMPHYAGNGFPPPMPPGLDMMGGTGNFEAYGRQNMPYASMDPYQQHPGNSFQPSTPLSFQDSQTSAHTDEHGGGYHQYGHVPSRNGPAGYSDDSAGQNQPARMYGAMEYAPAGPQRGYASAMMPHGDDASGLLEHFQQQFGTHDFADCSLELRNPDPRVPPIRIPAHRVVISRSPTLLSSLRKQIQEPIPQLIGLDVDDEWVHPDSFYMAFQRLYGLPLLQIPPPQHSMDPDSMSAGSTLERFKFALSYAAAGRLLSWDPVVRRGCEIAGQLFTLDNIETAMKFALSQYEDKSLYEKFKYGDGSRILLDSILSFIAGKLSPSFRLDTSVTTETQGYSRLPIDTPSPRKPVMEEVPSPVVVRGNSHGHFSKGSRTSNYPPHIQFGDLSLTNGGNQGSSYETPKASQPVNTTLATVISRILINLPFGYLKMLLESGRRGQHNDFRFAIVQQVVREREARRSRALEAVMAGELPESGLIQSGLRSLEPSQSTPWAVLGWEEQISYPSNADVPSLHRHWAPLKQNTAGSGEYP